MPANKGIPAPTERLRVLLVEDDVVDRMAFERFVRRQELDYSLRIVEGLAEARLALDSHEFDVVLTDYHLGDGCGTEVISLAEGLPVVVITGAGDEETAVSAMRAGASDYLIKDHECRYLELVPVAIEHARRHYEAEHQARILTQAVTSLNDAIYVTDLEGRLVFVNQTFLELYGDSQAQALGRRADDLWSDHPDQELLPTPPGLLPRGGEKGECLHQRRDGSTFTALLSRSPIFDSRGRKVASVGAVRDVSERRKWEDALRDSEERYAMAAAGANDGLWDWDLRSGRVHYSARWCSTLGYTEEEIGGNLGAWLELVHEDDRELLKAQLDAHVEGSTPHFENEHRIRTRAGDYRWVQVRGLAVRVAGSDGTASRATRMAGSQRDITDRKEAEEQLIHAALHDSLTGLPNRALFMDRLENALARGRRDKHDFGVVFLDLDRFKMINDSLGHAAGDQLLRSIAGRLEECLRQGDTVARLGGDEFALLLERLGSFDEVDAVAARVSRALEEPFLIDGHECFSGASIGIALSSTGYAKAEDLLRDADIAMYRAKAQGRMRWVFFQPHMHTQAMAALELENDLRRAIKLSQLEVFFQPILCLGSGRLSGFEALVRWRHPERGLVMPGEFLPLAQESDLSKDIGWWVLTASCRQLAAWLDSLEVSKAMVPSGLTVSINLDARQLASEDLLDRVTAVLAETGLDARRLRLEITESMIIQNPELSATILARLRKRGVQLHIDDFGTGYSSLGQLKTLPVDSLKIDRSFVQHMLEERDDREIVRSIVQLAHNLDLGVMAEGIETPEHLRALQEMHCDLGQGYLFARPLEAHKMESVLGSDEAFPGFEASADDESTDAG